MNVLSKDVSDRKWVIGIGGVKCATTWLAECLSAHPEINMSNHKEVHYFSSKYERGESWYLSNFDFNSDEHYLSEFSTSYLYHPDAAQRMKQFSDDVHIVVCLRNPFVRLVSHLKQLYRNGQIEKKCSIEQAVEKHPELLEYGAYYKYLKPYYQYFSPERISIVLTDDIEKNPLEVLHALFATLSIDSNYVPPFALKTIGKGITPKSMKLERWRQNVFFALRDAGLSWVISAARRSGLSAYYRHLNSSTRSESNYDLSRVMTLYGEYYDIQIKQMGELTGHDYNHWLSK